MKFNMEKVVISFKHTCRTINLNNSTTSTSILFHKFPHNLIEITSLNINIKRNVETTRKIYVKYFQSSHGHVNVSVYRASFCQLAYQRDCDTTVTHYLEIEKKKRSKDRRTETQREIRIGFIIEDTTHTNTLIMHTAVRAKR